MASGQATVCVPSAAPGDFVFVQVGERRALAIVDCFDGRRYVVRPRVAGSLPVGPNGTLAFTVAPPAVDQGDTSRAWSNAPAPTCCVCLGGDDVEFPRQQQQPRRMAVLACRCSVPSVCVSCARTLAACPQCRARLHTLPSGAIAVARLESPVEASTAMRLAMVSLAGKRHEITVSPSWSVRTLKAFYAHVAGAHPKQQTLKCAGVSLDNDNRDLGSYGLVDGQVVHVILNVVGD
ncbi:Ubiquitin [Pandoravirus salinus]|uniref:Ubiquitin n=1 Tax=Pandoravirus salinus TaxID=1349410 RepID=S4VT68_9VIRU|nr:Ubiquitin [Pandoravirus salinus]AGO83654.2 Ubiquitin [Pandoravirus salinus]